MNSLKMERKIQTGSEAVILPYEKQKEYHISSVEVANKPIYSFFKRALDILAAGIVLIVLIFPILVIAIIIKCTSRGTVFYCQDRLGLMGKKIRIIKLRSMYMNAEDNGAQWSSGSDDPRITPFGHFLRKFHIDELPQFWNIFIGDLSLVGPRPERECFYKEFETYIHGFSERLKVKPGLTGLAQISGGYALRPEEKIEYDMEYIKTRSFGLDLKILFKTFSVVFCQHGGK